MRAVLVVVALLVAGEARATQGLAQATAAALKGHPGAHYHVVRRLDAKLAHELDAHVKRLGAEHPGLTERELAELFAGDAVLSIFPWSQRRIHNLAHGVKDSPLAGFAWKHSASPAVFAALGDVVLATWSTLPKNATLDERLDAVQKVERDFMWTTLAKAAEANARLRKALRGVLLTDVDAPPPLRASELPAARLAAFRPTPAMIEHVVQRSGSTARRAALEVITALEREHGNNDGTLAPSDVTGAPLLVVALLERIWEVTGKRTLTLAEIDAQLPAALGRTFSRNAVVEHHPIADAIAREVLDDLALAYRAEVLEGASTSRTFVRQHRIQASTWAAWRRDFADVLPDAAAYTGKLTPKRLAIVEALYAQLLDERISVSDFYHRAGISQRQLRLLQAVEPERFPAASAPGIAPVRRVHTEPIDAKLEVRTEAWATAESDMTELARAHGLGNDAFARHPERVPPRSTIPTSQAKRTALREIMKRTLAADILTDRSHVLDAVNADDDFVARFGKLDRDALARLLRAAPGSFPTLPSAERITKALAEELAVIVAEHGAPMTQAEMLTALRPRHPHVTRDRIRAILAAFPSLVRPRERAPNKPPANTAPIWKAGGGPERRRNGREGRAMAELWKLIAEISPPGTSIEELSAAMNELLDERGVTPYESKQSAYAAYRKKGGLTTRDARLSALLPQIVDEYARAAAAGTTHEEIVRRVRADYPRLSATDFGKYLRGVRLVGRGETIDEPRYLGGWDPARALLRDPDTRLRIARATQYARIPLRLPLVEAVLDELAGSQPLRAHNVLWVSHVLATTFPLALALQQAGLTTDKTVVVGTPYGTNEAVHAAMQDRGFDVRVPTLSDEAYREEVRRALDDVVEKHARNHQPIIVLDDGGLVTELLHADPKYAHVRDHVRIVEQTTRGITVAEERELEVPIVNVARSAVKREEARFIGRAVAAKVLQGLRTIDREMRGLETTVIGYGNVGPAVAAALRAEGARVTIVEPNPGRARAAREAGYRVATKAEALARAELVIGATGNRSVTLGDLKRLRSGAVVASASSKQVEIDMKGLRADATTATRVPPRSPLVKLPTVRYRIGQRELTLLGDGWPINFDGDVEDLASDDIQLTRAAMLVGAVQAARMSHPGRGLVPLDEAMDQKLLASYRRVVAQRKTDPPIGDPTRWEDVVDVLGKRLFSKR